MFKDKDLLTLFDQIIDSYCTSQGKGLPIGNLTSQYFANTYLSVLDHKTKEEWKACIYIRYMDDILITGNSLDDLKQIVKEIITFASDHLKLSFKPPVYRKSKDGQTFLGYKVMPYHCKLSGRSKRRLRSKILVYNKLLEERKWTQEQYQEHVLPLLSFTNHAVSRDFRSNCLSI